METIQPSVLLLPTSDASCQEFFLLAERIQADGRYTPIVVCGKPGIYKKAQTEVPHILSLQVPAESPYHSWIELWVPARLRHLVQRLLRSSYWEELGQAKALLAHQLVQAESLYKQHSPAALLTASDRYGAFEAAFIRKAKEHDCRVIIISYALSSPESDANNRYTGKHRDIYMVETPPQGLLKRWIRWRHPSQIRTTEYGAMVFQTPVDTLALAHHGLLSANPWVIGCGESDLRCMASPVDYQRTVEQGAPPEKLRVVGQPSYDQLYEAAQNAQQKRDEWLTRHKLNPKRPLIMLSVPQLMEHGLLPAEQHWQEIDFLVRTLVETGEQVLLSLHPRSLPSNYRFLTETYPVQIAEESLRDILPYADLFLAVISSSTIEWGILLEVPTIAFDFYKLDARLYDQVEGLQKVYDKDELGPLLQRLLNDHALRERIREEQYKAIAALGWLPIDGHACQRIIDLI